MNHWFENQLRVRGFGLEISKIVTFSPVVPRSLDNNSQLRKHFSIVYDLIDIRSFVAFAIILRRE